MEKLAESGRFVYSPKAGQGTKSTGEAGAPSFDSVLGAVLSSVNSPEPTPEPVLNTSLRWCKTLTQQNKEVQASWDNAAEIMGKQSHALRERVKGTVDVPIGRDELTQFMAAVEEGMANGLTFAEIAAAQMKKHAEQDRQPGLAGVSSANADIFCINPDTGEVKHCFAKTRLSSNSIAEPQQDEDAAWDLAYDMQMFLQNSFFRSEHISAEEAEAIIADITARQSEKDFTRYDKPRLFSDGSHSFYYPTAEDERYLEALAAKEAAKQAEDSETAEEEPIDFFLQSIKEMQRARYEERVERAYEVQIED